MALTLTVGTATSRIATMSSDGSGLREFTHCDPPECLSDTSPAWSPDGSQLAWARVSGAGAVVPESIFVAEGTRPTLALPGLAFVGGLSWSPDGSSIAFDASEAGTKHFSIYVVSVRSGAVTRLTDCPMSECPMGDLHPSWAPDGSRIVFARDGGLDVMNADGSDVRHLYSCRPPCTSAMDPAWSPNGKEIAFAVQTEDQRDLYSMGWDGSNVRQLTDAPGDEFSPTWQGIPAGESEPPPGTTECIQGRTSGDFDGDGVADSAEFIEVASGNVSCSDAESLVQNLASQRVVIGFGSGGTLDVPFVDCRGGTCANIFVAVDLNGDGRDELAIDVGPGAAVDFVEFYRVNDEGISPLTIAGPADPPLVKAGPAVLGGSFDSGAQSPIECRVTKDGSREVVSIHAEPTGNILTKPWDVHRTTMVLQGNDLVVVSSGDRTEPWTNGLGKVFMNDC